MKCHYTYDDECGKVFIPGCMGTAVYNDMNHCTCGSNQTFNQFEKEKYNGILNEKNNQIEELEKENARLNRILGKVYGFR